METKREVCHKNRNRRFSVPTAISSDDTWWRIIWWHIAARTWSNLKLYTVTVVEIAAAGGGIRLQTERQSHLMKLFTVFWDVWHTSIGFLHNTTDDGVYISALIVLQICLTVVKKEGRRRGKTTWISTSSPTHTYDKPHWIETIKSMQTAKHTGTCQANHLNQVFLQNDHPPQLGERGLYHC